MEGVGGFDLEGCPDAPPASFFEDFPETWDDGDAFLLETDSISKRTRARLSLESVTLEELESSLKATEEEEEEDYFSKFDEEQEYQKFLESIFSDEIASAENFESLAVEPPPQPKPTYKNIRELLNATESKKSGTNTRKRGRPPKSKQPKPREERVSHSAHFRPLKPCKIENEFEYPTVFTKQQIGQLYSQMHEHIQLLIQLSLLSFDNDMYHPIFCSCIQFLREIVHKRKDVLSWKRSCFPPECFSSSFTQSSVNSGSDGWKFVSTSFSDQNCYEESNKEKVSWRLPISGRVFSIFDTDLLSLVEGFIEEMSSFDHRSKSSNQLVPFESPSTISMPILSTSMSLATSTPPPPLSPSVNSFMPFSVSMLGDGKPTGQAFSCGDQIQVQSTNEHFENFSMDVLEDEMLSATDVNVSSISFLSECCNEEESKFEDGVNSKYKNMEYLSDECKLGENKNDGSNVNNGLNDDCNNDFNINYDEIDPSTLNAELTIKNYDLCEPELRSFSFMEDSSLLPSPPLSPFPFQDIPVDNPSGFLSSPLIQSDPESNLLLNHSLTPCIEMEDENRTFPLSTCDDCQSVAKQPELSQDHTQNQIHYDYQHLKSIDHREEHAESCDNRIHCISCIFHRFLSFFNPSLFVLPPTSRKGLNRSLFTPAEDRLLMMGVETFNRNWNAIRMRYLPTKTPNQIRLRYKNCCSSGRKDNPLREFRKRELACLTWKKSKKKKNQGQVNNFQDQAKPILDGHTLN